MGNYEGYLAQQNWSYGASTYVMPRQCFTTHTTFSYGCAPAPPPVKPKKEGRPMRSLYHVYIVDPEEEKILGDSIAIAENPEASVVKATLQMGLKLEKQLSEYDIITECVSRDTIRPHVDTQKVRIIGKEKIEE
jgi:hypothetical protein